MIEQDMQSRNLELDRLRAFAVLMTLNFHFENLLFPWTLFHPYRVDGTPLNVFNNSWSGVDLFLVISGFIICKTIVERLDQLRDSPSLLVAYVKAFYVRRIFRIYPVAWTVFFLVLAGSIIFNEGDYFSSPTNNIESGITIFTYTYNYFAVHHCFSQTCALGPYWSLSLEEQFYFILPFFLILTGSTRLRIWILVGLLLAITFIVRPVLHDDVLFFFMQNRGDGLLYGCLIYFLTQQPWFKVIQLPPGRSSWFSSLLVATLLLILAGIPGVGFSSSLVIPVACWISLILVTIASCEANIINFPRPVNLLLDYLGSRSYSMYLVHMPMVTLTQEILLRYSRKIHEPLGTQLLPEYLILASSLSLIATEIIYRAIERPMIAKGKIVSERILDLHGIPAKKSATTQRNPVLETSPGALVK
ncbi:hypothetical protein WI38_05000 [Burkholderia ubonensis]|uniref:Acyltransferase 3 domain-containing protein n=2 Tax=Burkholderia ubonensis TaxID=101571 RepID=A0A102LL83_9BURK|nr:acyltransferase [Burkholderia ubonensis]KUZ65733.1 hypothetical protein WI35_22980 [Burkholderia ubonensis]KUZ95631.1 hypothetical protein WI38_05000 [Burkholderia ubonensis]KVA00111.1 hypothetical protein WI39_05835 [Burkholderia ubonensis]